MSTKLSNTATIFQLAFGLNAVCAILINRYLAQRSKVISAYVDRIKVLKPEFSIDGKEESLKRVMAKAMPGYRLLKKFFVFCISLAALSLVTSFLFLLAAAIRPDNEVSDSIFALLAFILVITNPAIYYIFFVLLDMLLEGVNKRMEINLASVESLELFLGDEELLAEVETLLLNTRMESLAQKFFRWKAKFLNALNKLLHPIETFETWRKMKLREKLVQKALRELDRHNAD